MTRMTVRLPRALYAELKAIARRSGRPTAEVMREALAIYLAEQERRWPRTIGIVESGAVSGADSEDWLRENWKPDW